MNKNDFIILTILIAIGTAIGFYLGVDATWDFSNYHYYGVWALFHNRIGQDIMPGGIISYMNPILDIPLYFYIKFFNNTPHLISFLQSIWWGISVFLVYKISGLIFISKNRNFYIATSVLIGSSGIMSIWCNGVSSNDLQICTISLFALFLTLKNLWIEDFSKRNRIMFVVGLLTGLATGLKYVGMYAFIGILACVILTSLFREIKKPQKLIALIIGGFLAGFAITGLWWCILLWQKFGNPFFPKLNQIFQSPLALPISYADVRHNPESLLQYVFYPFYWVANPDRRFVFEYDHVDFRQVSLYVSAIITCVFAIISKIKPTIFSNVKEIINQKNLFFLNSLLIVTYLIWLNTTCYLRYLLMFELLAGILIIGTIIFIFSKTNENIKKVAIVLIMLFLAFSTRYCHKEETRIFFEEKYLWKADLKLPDDAIVLQLGGFPSAIFIPFQNPNAQWIYIYGECWNFNFKYPSSQEEKIKKIIAENKDKIYLLYSDCEPAFIDWEYVKQFVNMDDFDCEAIDNNEPCRNYYFCKLKRKK